tara:strand:- start:81431 stop:82663 length:1233 start_codon:yes stop_codon:yes gene_type:complete
MSSMLDERRNSLASSMSLAQLGMGWLSDQAGGLNRYFYDFLHELQKREIDAESWVAGPIDLQTDVGVHPFARRDASLLSRLCAARRLLKRIAENPPDVLASHFALYMAPGFDYLRDIPIVCHFHGPWADEAECEGDRGLSNRFKRLIEQTTYHRADRLITLSQAFADVLVNRYGVDSHRIRVIPGGVDLDRFNVISSRCQARQRLSWDVDGPILLCVRRLVPRMGIERLIDAMADVVKASPNVRLMIGGRGPLAESLQSYIESRDLAQHVCLLGFIDDDLLPTAYRAADFSVVPTVALEGFGLTVAESLASGTPCLVTPVGGLPEVVNALSQALIFRSTSVEDIATGINAALANPSSFPDALTCRAYAETHFDWSRIVEQVLEVYQEAIASRIDISRPSTVSDVNANAAF